MKLKGSKVIALLVIGIVALGLLVYAIKMPKQVGDRDPEIISTYPGDMTYIYPSDTLNLSTQVRDKDGDIMKISFWISKNITGNLYWRELNTQYGANGTYTTQINLEVNNSNMSISDLFNQSEKCLWKVIVSDDDSPIIKESTFYSFYRILP
jgi:hypothetical protein